MTIRVAALWFTFLATGCGRLRFDELAGDGATGDGVKGEGGAGGLTLQSTSQSGPCNSGCNSGPSHPIAHDLLAGTERLLVVFSGCGENAVAPSTASYGGVAMTHLGGAVNFGSFKISGEVFYLVESQLAPLTNTPHDVIFPLACYAGIALQFDGVDQANPIGDMVTLTSMDPTTSTIAVTTSDTGAIIVDGVASGREEFRVHSVPPPQVERGHLQYDSNSGGVYTVSTRPWQQSSTSMIRNYADPMMVINFPFEVHVGAAVHPAP